MKKTLICNISDIIQLEDNLSELKDMFLIIQYSEKENIPIPLHIKLTENNLNIQNNLNIYYLLKKDTTERNNFNLGYFTGANNSKTEDSTLTIFINKGVEDKIVNGKDTIIFCDNILNALRIFQGKPIKSSKTTTKKAPRATKKKETVAEIKTPAKEKVTVEEKTKSVEQKKEVIKEKVVTPKKETAVKEKTAETETPAIETKKTRKKKGVVLRYPEETPDGPAYEALKKALASYKANVSSSIDFIITSLQHAKKDSDWLDNLKVCMQDDDSAEKIHDLIKDHYTEFKKYADEMPTYEAYVDPDCTL